MIAWAEAKPDFELQPLSDLTSRLPFTTACQIACARGGLLRVALQKDAWLRAVEHVACYHVESGGLLVGRVYENSRGVLITEIEHSVPAGVFDGTGTSLQMSADVWEAARRETPPGSYPVGWYHSHPNLGAFFSGTDRRTQASFFANAYSIGLVIDPIRNEAAWFAGADSMQLDPAEVFDISPLTIGNIVLEGTSQRLTTTLAQSSARD